MKISVEFDMTPEEFRQSLGLPDVQVFQKEMIDAIIAKMQTGEDGYDPFTLFKPFMDGGLNAMPSIFMNMMAGASQNKGSGE